MNGFSLHIEPPSYNVCYSRAISSCDIGNFIGILLYCLSDFSLYSNVYIHLHEYINETNGNGLCHSNKLAPFLLLKGHKLLRYE